MQLLNPSVIMMKFFTSSGGKFFVDTGTQGNKSEDQSSNEPEPCMSDEYDEYAPFGTAAMIVALTIIIAIVVDFYLGYMYWRIHLAKQQTPERKRVPSMWDAAPDSPKRKNRRLNAPIPSRQARQTSPSKPGIKHSIRRSRSTEPIRNFSKNRPRRRRNSFVTAHGARPRASSSIQEVAEGKQKENQKLKHLIMSHLTFSEWLEFRVTLRVEHFVDKTIQFCAYIWWRLRGLLRKAPSEAEAQTALVRLLWNCASITAFTGLKDGAYTFAFNDFNVTTSSNTIKNYSAEIILPVETLILEYGQVQSAKCTITVNGEPTSAVDFYALFYWGVLATWIHPKIHVMASWISRYKYRGGIFRKMHIYTTSMNDASMVAGAAVGDMTKCPMMLRKTLEKNVLPGMWRHSNVREFESENRMVWFVMRARTTLANVIEDNGVGINPEVFFLGSVLHSLDHTLTYQNTSWTTLLKSSKFDVDARLFAFLFVNPTRGWIVNTRLSACTEPWLVELHRELQNIDPVYAGLVHHCISW